MLQYSHHPSPFPVRMLIVAELLIQAPIRTLPCSRPTPFPRGEGLSHKAVAIVCPSLGVRAAEWQGRPGETQGGRLARDQWRRSSPIQLWRGHHDETSTAPHEPEPCGCFAISGVFSAVSLPPPGARPWPRRTQPPPRPRPPPHVPPEFPSLPPPAPVLASHHPHTRVHPRPLHTASGTITTANRTPTTPVWPR